MVHDVFVSRRRPGSANLAVIKGCTFFGPKEKAPPALSVAEEHRGQWK